MIINAGLTRVYYLEGYADEIARQIIAEANFPVIQLDAPADPDAAPPSRGRSTLPIVSSG